jgi:hypothetical protein
MANDKKSQPFRALNKRSFSLLHDMKQGTTSKAAPGAIAQFSLKKTLSYARYQIRQTDKMPVCQMKWL